MKNIKNRYNNDKRNCENCKKVTKDRPADGYNFSESLDKVAITSYTKDAGRNKLYTHIPEFTFKCHVLAPAVGKPPVGGFF
ncbi:MAG: hypothetical protein LUB59_03150 [Candidatus Gastranaerophilales bacterium]|nr:hypothetical protein [Candidatus Gastranaerophilales bacterium]